ncbi:MAG: CHAT domain-containing protein, partial [Cytophagales bacterium]|nr:CHAT domain-containing protein [Cytophagales bacterium]
DAKALEADIEKLEKSLSTRSTLFASKEKKQVTKWTDIRSVLTDKEVAVEIIRYPIFNKKTTDTIKYVALIIHKGSLIVPELVRIGDGKELETKWLKYYRNSMTYKSNDEFSYNKFWKALKADIPDGQTIYLSSEGVYNQLNVETITDPNGVYILDKNPVVLVTNTRDLVPESSKELPANTNPSVLSGAPEFYVSAGANSRSIVDLPGAEVEVNSVKTLFEAAGAPTEVLYKKEVLEDTIKSLKSPRIFHIATHGYFRETTETNDEDPASNPLLNSGLMLAGSGDIIDNKENGYVNQKPGVLTAQEALDLNFDNTDLVVLSACETGRGSIQVGEGVYGLQRAFLTAGSKAIILSLFKVNDEVTQKLMKLFYQKVLSGQTIRQSFAEAKKQIKAEFPEPIYWGAFVLIESSPKAKISMKTGPGVARK